MVTLYIDGPKDGGEGIYYLVTSEGEVLASHFCSNVDFAELDLIENRQERIEEWKELLKDGYKLEIASEEKSAELMELNSKL